MIECGEAVSTAVGLVRSVKQNGLGFMAPELVAATASTVKTWMGGANLPAANKLYANQFVGSVKLSEAEWSAVEARSQRLLPKKKPG